MSSIVSENHRFKGFKLWVWTHSLFVTFVTNNSRVRLFSGPEFVFNQQEQREDFQFGFISKSPQKDKKDNGFPFSFNF